MSGNLTDKFNDLKGHMDYNLALLMDLLGAPTEEEDNKGILTTLYLIPHALGDVNTGIGNMETSLGIALNDIKVQDYYYGELISTKIQDFHDDMHEGLFSRLDTIRDLLLQTNRLLLAQHSVVVNPPCPCDPDTPLLTSPPFAFIDDGDVEMCERTNFYVDWFQDWLNAYTTALTLGVVISPQYIAAYQQQVRPDATYNSVGAVDGAAVSDVAALQYYAGQYVLDRDDLAILDVYTHWVSQGWRDAFVTMISDEDSYASAKGELQAWYEDLAGDATEGPIARLVYYFFNMGFLRDIFSETSQDLSAYEELCGGGGAFEPLRSINVSDSGSFDGFLVTVRLQSWDAVAETMPDDITISATYDENTYGYEGGFLSGALDQYLFAVIDDGEATIDNCRLFTSGDDVPFVLTTTPVNVTTLTGDTVIAVIFGDTNLTHTHSVVEMTHI